MQMLICGQHQNLLNSVILQISIAPKYINLKKIYKIKSTHSLHLESNDQNRLLLTYQQTKIDFKKIEKWEGGGKNI